MKATAQHSMIASAFLALCLLSHEAAAFIGGGIQRQRAPSPSALHSSVTWNNGNNYGKVRVVRAYWFVNVVNLELFMHV